MDAIQEAKRLFNETWDLLDKTDRTDEDTILMLHKVHTSCFLWRAAESPRNDATGEWQVSHVYSVIQDGALALLHGQRSLAICLKAGLTGLVLAFGYEAVARAYVLLGDVEKAEEARTAGILAAQAEPDESERRYVLGELNSF